LRERGGDVIQLAEAFLEKYSPGVTFSADAAQALEQHTWPGNVRELKNVIERSSIVVGSEREIHAKHILF
jgi:transcriptional regulator with PAS, ATPase and Fis domain